MPKLSTSSPSALSIAWLNNLSDAVDELRRVYPDMTLNHVAVLLCVALKPGVSQREIMERTGLADSSSSRIVAILAEYGNRGTGPFGLVEQCESATDRRIKEHHLTAKGRDLMTRLTAMIGRGK